MEPASDLALTGGAQTNEDKAMPNSRGDLSGLVGRYRRVVKAEASLQSLEETLSLVKDIAASGLGVLLAPGLSQAEPDELFPADLIETVEPGLREIRLNRHGLKVGPRNRELVYQIVAALTLPSLVGDTGLSDSTARTSLLIDAIQVLFHQAYFVLVADSGILSAKARKLLLDVFLRYANRLPSMPTAFERFRWFLRRWARAMPQGRLPADRFTKSGRMITSTCRLCKPLGVRTSITDVSNLR